MTSISSSQDPYIGELVANRLQLKHLIGKDVMGPVYYAEDLGQKGKAYALKFLSPTLASADMRQRFARAAQIGTNLGKKSIHIIQVKAYGIHQDKIPYYVMELLEGQTLKDILKQEPLSLNTFFKMCRQICLGLLAAHQGVEINGTIYPVIHRNIKPANIMVTTSPKGDELIKILDFGIAKLIGDTAQLTQTGSFLGTLAYCSPEQMEGQELDNRSDIYSLGAVMFEMLTGQRPWLVENSQSYGVWYKIHLLQPPRDFKTVNPKLKIPDELENLVILCLSKQAGSRPQSIDEVLKGLEDIAKQLTRIRKVQNPPESFQVSPSPQPSSSVLETLNVSENIDNQLNSTRKVHNQAESFQTSPSPDEHSPSPDGGSQVTIAVVRQGELSQSFSLGNAQNDSIKTPASKLKPPDQVEQISAYLHRAQQYIEMKNWSKAITELRDGLMLAPNNSTCHCLLGMVYLKQNHLKLADVHINKVLQLNPQNAKALHLKQILDKLSEKASASETTTTPKL